MLDTLFTPAEIPVDAFWLDIRLHGRLQGLLPFDPKHFPEPANAALNVYGRRDER